MPPVNKKENSTASIRIRDPGAFRLESRKANAEQNSTLKITALTVMITLFRNATQIYRLVSTMEYPVSVKPRGQKKNPPVLARFASLKERQS